MTKTNTRFFISGIIQGSHSQSRINRQTYRSRLTRILSESYPHTDIYDPAAIYTDSLSFSDSKARQVFHEEMTMAGAPGTIMISYLPRASMGTAIEMWEAHKAGNPVYIITPMGINWAVKFLATRVFRTITEFKAFARSGRLAPNHAQKAHR